MYTKKSTIVMKLCFQDIIALSKNVIMLLLNLSQEQSCHHLLVQNNIPQTILPFCFHSNIQIRWECKSFLALLYKLAGPWYYHFLRLYANEISLLRLCFLSAATSPDHYVLLKLDSSTIRYSAFELALGIVSLTNHKSNATAFADPEIITAAYNLCLTGSIEEKRVSIGLISNLVNDPAMCSVVLENHPDMLEALQSLVENDEVGEEAAKLLQLLLDRVSGVIDEGEQEPIAAGDEALQRKRELERLLAWAARDMKNSKVLHNAADYEGTSMSMIYLISHLCEISYYRESCLSMHITLQSCPEFLSVLQDYIQRHFISKFIDNTYNS